MDVKMTAEELTAFLGRVFPQIASDFVIEEVAPRHVRVRLCVEDRHLRPGGTVSGPSVFALADVAVYIGLLAMIGPAELSVTTNCSIDFMRKPAARVDLIAECRMLKIGRSLAIGDVLIFSEGMTEPVARATLTYSIPPK
ncbi:MAG: PaaI family thioesterase [Roseovarius sp.]|nr:PaaI family thioesterase [Roseovarius sp.]